MMQSTETILLVDDEEPVRRTFEDWLRNAELDVQILAAHDAESALQLANEHTVDLAVLDWALGAGDDGLQLLQDLYQFHPDVVAIMITGFANQATPLDAMRMGVRDYLDKNQDLNRDTFLRAVKRQLDFIRPAKRERQLNQRLAAFREAVETILPLVQSAAALNDRTAIPEAMSSLFRFLRETTRAQDAVLIVRHYDAKADPPETCRAYNVNGEKMDVELGPFAHSVAASVVSLQEPRVMRLVEADAVAVELQPFERNRRSLLAAPLAVTSDLQVVLELFDKQGAEHFTEQDQRIVGAAAEFGGELFRQTLSHRRTHQVLFDAVETAMQTSQRITDVIGREQASSDDEPPPDTIMERLREGLQQSTSDTMSADDSLRLAEAIRVLAQRHGDPAVRHCIALVEQLRKLLDDVMGM